MIAMTVHVLYPKASTENQGSASENIFLSIDTKTQGLIEILIASDHKTQTQITSMQGSIALARLIKNIMVKTTESCTSFVSRRSIYETCRSLNKRFCRNSHS
jgi:hypothetical protein